MKYRTLDQYGDYTFGRRVFYTGREAVAQAIITRMRLLYGEWWENLDDGLPLFERILSVYGGEVARSAVDLLISERIQGTQNVRQMVRYESSFDPVTRNYSATCTVNTAFGEIYLITLDNFRNVEVKF